MTLFMAGEEVRTLFKVSNEMNLTMNLNGADMEVFHD